MHRFKWLENKEIGSIPKTWNWLAIEYPEKKNLDIIHYTLGTPCFKEYADKSLSNFWKKSYRNLSEGLEK